MSGPHLPPPPIRLTPEPTLGDILGAALGGEAARLAEIQQQKIAARAQYLSAWKVADDLAPLLDLPPNDVFEALTYIPDNMLGLLHSPEGWSALAEYAATRLGLTAPRYLPTRH